MLSSSLIQGVDTIPIRIETSGSDFDKSFTICGIYKDNGGACDEMIFYLDSIFSMLGQTFLFSSLSGKIYVDGWYDTPEGITPDKTRERDQKLNELYSDFYAVNENTFIMRK